MDAYWQTYLDARLAQDEHDDIFIEPGAHQGPDFPGADNLGGGGTATAVPAPFFIPRFSRFIHADSKPTAHEWEHNLCCELGEHAACHCGESLRAPVHEVTNGHF